MNASSPSTASHHGAGEEDGGRLGRNLKRTAPLLFFGTAMVVLGAWLALAHGALNLGRTAFWPYLLVIGGIALAGGGASSIVDWGTSNREESEPEFRLGPDEIIVPKTDWEEWQRSRSVRVSESPPAVAAAPPLSVVAPAPPPAAVVAIPAAERPPLPLAPASAPSVEATAPGPAAAPRPATRTRARAKPPVARPPGIAPRVESGRAVDTVTRELEQALGELQRPTTAPRAPRRARPAPTKSEMTCVGCYSRSVASGDAGACRSCGQPMCPDCAAEADRGKNPGLCPICSNLLERAARE